MRPDNGARRKVYRESAGSRGRGAQRSDGDGQGGSGSVHVHVRRLLRSAGSGGKVAESTVVEGLGDLRNRGFILKHNRLSVG